MQTSLEHTAPLLESNPFNSKRSCLSDIHLDGFPPLSVPESANHGGVNEKRLLPGPRTGRESPGTTTGIIEVPIPPLLR
jgi:hypothetical protein